LNLQALSSGSFPGCKVNPVSNAIDWAAFKGWLEAQYSPKHARQVYTRAVTYYEAATDTAKAAQLKALSKDKRRLIMESLAAFSKFTGTYETWQTVRRQSGLKWGQSDPLSVVNALLSRETAGAIDWLREVTAKLPIPYRTVLVFAALTGMRATEAANACGLVYDLSSKGQLADYYDGDLKMLQHFKYPKLFLRRTKNAYISFVSPQLIEAIAASKPIAFSTVSKAIRSQLDMSNQANQLRKYHATFLRKHLEQEMIDLIQGRVGTSVFAKHYYRPLIEELRDRVLTATAQLEKELLPLLDPRVCTATSRSV